MIHGLDTSFLVAVEIEEHTCHTEARRMLDEFLNRGDRFALAPQILFEFVHTVTDPRRFQVPLTMETALRHSEKLWSASEAGARYDAGGDLPERGRHLAAHAQCAGFYGVR